MMRPEIWVDADTHAVRVQHRAGGPIVELRDGEEPREVFARDTLRPWVLLRYPGECDCEAL
jgi:hypothetical protein